MFENIRKMWAELANNAKAGLVAGVAGIGGGIYLVPLIIVLGLGTAKEAAACGAIHDREVERLLAEAREMWDEAV